MAKEVIATICRGYRIETEGHVFEVLGSMIIRGRYLYTVRDVRSQRKVSISRDDVLAAQAEGTARVVAPVF